MVWKIDFCFPTDLGVDKNNHHRAYIQSRPHDCVYCGTNDQQIYIPLAPLRAASKQKIPSFTFRLYAEPQLAWVGFRGPSPPFPGAGTRM